MPLPHVLSFAIPPGLLELQRKNLLYTWFAHLERFHTVKLQMDMTTEVQKSRSNSTLTEVRDTILCILLGCPSHVYSLMDQCRLKWSCRDWVASRCMWFTGNIYCTKLTSISNRHNWSRSIHNCMVQSISLNVHFTMMCGYSKCTSTTLTVSRLYLPITA